MTETITEAVGRHAGDQPHRTALTDGITSLSWSEVKSWMDDAAGWLSDLGLPRGATVLGWLPNCLEWYLIRLACEQAGLFWVPVPTSQGRRELTSILERTRPSVLVTKDHFRNHDYSVEADEMCGQLGLAPLRVTVPDDRLLRLRGSVSGESVPLRLEERAHALPTSGSEGMPKLAVYTLSAACERAHAQAQLLELSREDVILVLSPGTGPARVGWLAAPIAGACVVVMPKFGIDAALGLIQSTRATLVCGTPAQLAMLAAKLHDVDTSSVRIWYAVGSVMPPTLAGDLETLTKGIVVSNYGGSDFGGWAAPDLNAGTHVRHNTVGRPRGGTEFRIIDDHGNDVSFGYSGELIGRGPCSVSDFLGEEGRQAWRDGWFHTGDLASFDDDGNLVIVGRLKEVIVRGGDKVSPVEIEALLRTHCDIAQVAVIGIPDSMLGERICACIVPVQGKHPPELETLRHYLDDQGLAHYKIPDRLVVLESLPIVGDKVDRRRLAQIAGAS
ncbi:MAG: acyl--CoA ligase [Acidimicrobiaceae bacterium]|nr:acyl--CoA ligase [Acidimicrobiaceae bacterium]